MATVNPQPVVYAYTKTAPEWEWLNIAAGDTIGWLTVPGKKADCTVHCYGTFGGTVTIQGTMESPGTANNPVTLNDSRGEGNALTFTADDMRVVLEHPLQMRPSPGAGVTATTVRMRFT